MKYRRKFMTSMLALTLLSSGTGYTAEDLVSYSKMSELHDQVQMKSSKRLDQKSDSSDTLSQKQKKQNRLKRNQ
jgi:hypothetical protein